MNTPKESEQVSSDPAIWRHKLMVSGPVCPECSRTLSVEVRRGMPILSKEGLEVGRVAAVVVDGSDGKATHILLSRLPETAGYWLVPLNLISEAYVEKIQLSIPGEAVDSLPRWQSSG